MASARDIRRLAFQTLYQIDARGGGDRESVRDAMGGAEGYSDGERARAFDLAVAAYDDRARADAAVEALAPTWPAYRQPAVDRAILRLAHHELAGGREPPKIVINDAIELAKEFSTEKSPGFVNAVLDKIMKAGGGERDGATAGEDGGVPGASPAAEADPGAGAHG